MWFSTPLLIMLWLVGVVSASASVSPERPGAPEGGACTLASREGASLEAPQGFGDTVSRAGRRAERAWTRAWGRRASVRAEGSGWTAAQASSQCFSPLCRIPHTVPPLFLTDLAEGFPGGLLVKSPPCNAGHTGLTPGPGRSLVPGSS